MGLRERKKPKSTLLLSTTLCVANKFMDGFNDLGSIWIQLILLIIENIAGE